MRNQRRQILLALNLRKPSVFILAVPGLPTERHHPPNTPRDFDNLAPVIYAKSVRASIPGALLKQIKEALDHDD
jgi:hypothetical protein